MVLVKRKRDKLTSERKKKKKKRAEKKWIGIWTVARVDVNTTPINITKEIMVSVKVTKYGCSKQKIKSLKIKKINK